MKSINAPMNGIVIRFHADAGGQVLIVRNISRVTEFKGKIVLFKM